MKVRTLCFKETCKKGILGLAVGMFAFWLSATVALAAEGTVKADTAKIRKEASTESEVIGSTSSGSKIDVVGGVKDASGTVWYKVPNGNNTYGYIRSDLLSVSGDVKITENSAGNSGSSSSQESSPEATVPTTIAEQQATVKESSIRVRSGASTNHAAVETIEEGTVMTLIGEATDNSGNKWYQMKCEYNGKTVEGYVRSDLISIGAPVVNEETPADGSESTGEEVPADADPNAPVLDGTGMDDNVVTPEVTAEPEHNDYEVVYNNDEYWLYINTEGTMMKVDDIMNVLDTANESYEKLNDQIKSNKIIIVILALIIALLVVAVTFLIFKLRDVYYGDYYEDEDEEEEEEAEEARPARREQEYKRVQETPSRKVREEDASASRREEPARRENAKREESAGREAATLQAAEVKAPTKKQPARRAQNFLLDDDEFEFEFLNMDDKDI